MSVLYKKYAKFKQNSFKNFNLYIHTREALTKILQFD